MRPLKLSMLGVRGVVGETLTPELIVAFAQAFGTWSGGGTILVSRDPRSSGEMVASAVFSGLLATGCEVVDLGVCPTPALQLAVRDSDSAGGVAVSAGHNDEEWNALKFVHGDGLLLNAFQGEELLDVFHQGAFTPADWTEMRPLRDGADGRDALLEQAKRVIAQVDRDAIARRQLRVAVDCCNGACSLTTPRLLQWLEVEPVLLNDTPDLPFPHVPEPSPATMSALRAVVKATGADLGLAHDADGERLALVTEDAEALSEEDTLCILADFWLAENPGPVVCNLSTTLAMDALAARHNIPLIRTRVGQAHVVEGIVAKGAVLGGEGSGGVIFPRYLLAHDALATAAWLLHFLAMSGETLSQRAASIPRYHTLKRKIPYGPERIYGALYQYREAVERDSQGAETDFTEGVRSVWSDGDGVPEAAIHVRSSTTEPFIRIIAEAHDPDRAERLAEEAIARLQTGP